MRFHCVALPHTTLGPEHSACAFSMKVRHFIQMMKSLGHDCFHYGAEGSDIGPWCKENVPIITTQEQLDFFGPHEPNSFYNVGFTGREPYWTLFNQRAAAEINKRKQRKDFVCIIMGTLQQSVAEQTEGDAQIVEYGIGYNGPLPRKAGRFRVYESYVHMHKLWGAEGGYDPNGYFYDAVIPNYFDPNDYPLQTEKGDYYLYIGRLVQRKGIHIAVETCKRLGVKLKIVGQGGRQEGNKIIANDGEVYEGDNLEYIGFANGAKRAALYQNAIATFVPTWYVGALWRRRGGEPDGRHPGLDNGLRGLRRDGGARPHGLSLPNAQRLHSRGPRSAGIGPDLLQLSGVQALLDGHRAVAVSDVLQLPLGPVG